MDFTGLVLYRIADLDRDFVDMRGTFLTGQGPHDLAMYGFDTNSNSADQAIATATVNAKVIGQKLALKIDILGERPTSPLDARITREVFNNLASKKGDHCTIKFSEVSPGSFNVILVRAAGKIDLEVPFDGDPGELATEKFPGKLSLWGHSKDKGVDMLTLIEKTLRVLP